MTTSITSGLKIAFVPGQAESLQQKVGDNAPLSARVDRVIQLRNSMYFGFVATIGLAVTGLLTDGGYSMLSLGLAGAAAAITGVVVNTLQNETDSLRT